VSRLAMEMGFLIGAVFQSLWNEFRAMWLACGLGQTAG
jgi:hypothetical protein